MMYAVDWPLALEFTKALAGPIATVAVVVVVARQARLTFLRQKVAEKRFDWHETVHSVLDELHKAYIDIQIAGERKESIEPAVNAMKAIGLRFLKIADRSWLFAGPRGFHAVQQLISQLAEAREWEMKSFSASHVAKVADLLETASIVLSAELREHMKMEPLDAQAVRSLLRMRSTPPRA